MDMNIREAICHESIDALLVCLKAGEDPSIRDEGGTTCLDDLMWIEDNDIRHSMLKILLSNGADPNIRDDENGGVLTNMLMIHDTRCVATLLESGANPNFIVDIGESEYDKAVFDYCYDEYDIHLPEPPSDKDIATPDAWLQMLERLAKKYDKKPPDHLILMRRFGAKTARELEAEK
jgi:hypothetical protein